VAAIHLNAEILAIAVLVAAASGAGTGLLMLWLRRRMILDHPVERSSHEKPVPKGGGAAVVTALLAGWVALAVLGVAPSGTLIVCTLGFVLAALSWINDVAHIPAALRLGVHLLVAAVGLTTLPGRGHVFQGLLPPAWDDAAAVLLWAWFLNLYNFMDGIDGITVVETCAIAAGLLCIALLTGIAPGATTPFAALLAAAVLGFLPWNWHKAKIFLGDVGSVPLGFLAGWLLLGLAGSGMWAPPLVLALYYLADATVTLAHRLAAGEKVWQAHRSHFYQRALGSDGNHAAVALIVLAGDIALIGAAVVAISEPAFGVALGALFTAGLLFTLDWRGRRGRAA